MKVLVLNGPNLGRLGTREPDVYGTTTHADLVDSCERTADQLGIDVEVRQTDYEGRLVGWLHEATDTGCPVVLNAAALTHYSVAVRDAAAQLREPLIELHISNVHAREEFRSHSMLADIATAVMSGFGVDGYSLALRWLAGDHPERITTINHDPE